MLGSLFSSKALCLMLGTVFSLEISYEVTVMVDGNNITGTVGDVDLYYGEGGKFSVLPDDPLYEYITPDLGKDTTNTSAIVADQIYSNLTDHHLLSRRDWVEYNSIEDWEESQPARIFKRDASIFGEQHAYRGHGCTDAVEILRCDVPGILYSMNLAQPRANVKAYDFYSRDCQFWAYVKNNYAGKVFYTKGSYMYTDCLDGISEYLNSMQITCGDD